jgi:hypothetical protein
MGPPNSGGLTTSTLLTLVVVPVIYTYLAGWEERRAQRRAAVETVDVPAPGD